MKRILMVGLPLVALGACVVAAFLALTSEKGQVCLNKTPGNLIGCLLAPPVALSVNVSGSVDEVLILRAGDDLVMARIVTNGQDVKQTVNLSTAHQYYLVIRKGDETRTGRVHGFSTTQGSAQQEVLGLDQCSGPL